MNENMIGYTNVYNELKTMCVEEGYRELSGDEVIFAAYILLKMQQYDGVKTYDDFFASWEENHIAYQKGFWTPMNNIGMSFDPEAHGNSYEDEEARENLIRWEKLKQLKNVYHRDDLINCILFGKIDMGFKLSRTPSELNVLASKLFEINESDTIADFSTGENVFFRDCFFLHPQNRYFVFKSDEDYAEAIFVRACALGLEIENDYCTSLFDEEEHKQGYDKIFIDFNRADKRETDDIEIKQYMTMQDEECFIKGMAPEWYCCMTAMKYLKEKGRMIAVVPRSLLSNKNSESAREYFLDHGYIETVISLPERLYEDTIMPTAMIVFSRGNKEVSFVDARDYGYSSRYGARRMKILSEQDVEQILLCVDTVSDTSNKVDYEVLKGKKYSLNPKTYLLDVDSEGGIIFEDVIVKITRGVQLSGTELDAISTENRTDNQYVTPASIQYGSVYRPQCYLKHIVKKHEKYVAQAGDILVTKNVVSFKVAVVKHSNFLVSGNLYLIRVNQEKVNPHFIKLYLESTSGQKIIQSLSSGGAASMLSVAAIKSIPIPRFSLKEQEKMQREYEELESEIYAKQKELEQLLEEQCKLFEWEQ